MENKQHVLKILALLMFSALMASCSVIQQAIEKPTVHVKEVKYQPINLQEGRLDSRLLISNPNGFALPLRTMTYQLILNGHEFAESRLSFDRNIPAKGSIEIAVPIHIAYGGLLDGITSVLMHREMTFQLRGTLDLRLVQAHFSKTGKFTLSH